MVQAILKFLLKLKKQSNVIDAKVSIICPFVWQKLTFLLPQIQQSKELLPVHHDIFTRSFEIGQHYFVAGFTIPIPDVGASVGAGFLYPFVSTMRGFNFPVFSLLKHLRQIFEPSGLSTRPCIYDITIESKSSMKVLGVTVDNQLKWENHVKKVVNKCRSFVFTLRYIRRFLNNAVMSNVIKAHVISRIAYASPCWSNFLRYNLKNKIKSVYFHILRVAQRDFDFNLNRATLLSRMDLGSNFQHNLSHIPHNHLS